MPIPEPRPSSQAVDPVREAALRILVESERDGQPSKGPLERAEAQLAREDDRALLHSLVLETFRHRARLDALLDEWLAPRRVDDLPPWIRGTLRLGLCQLVAHSRIAPHAAVDTSVSLARRHGHRGTVGLVNAVLRRATREGRARWDALDAGGDAIDLLARRYSVPEWIARRWVDRWGSDRAERALAHSAGRPDYWLRLSPRAAASAEEAGSLDFASIGARDWIPGALRAPAGSRPADRPEFQQGLYSIQDGSAILVGLLAPRVRGRVLDLCAAPGTKTGHLWERAEPDARIVALDRSAERIKLVGEGLRRLGATGVDLIAADGRMLPLRGRFDGILIDAPCSNLGVLRRRVDARWRTEESSIAPLAKAQAELLSAAASRLHPGGWLVYSVCTTEPEETTEQRDRFLAANEEFRPLPLPSFLPAGARGREGELILVPGEQGTDGGYAFVVERADASAGAEFGGARE